MKKLSTLLWAILLSAATYAQLPNGSIAPNFTATDLQGNTWNLYDILDQGKSVMINFSATWAPPAWNYHNTNILQQFYELHGPAGDNSAVVFWIEGDVSTNINCITNSPGCNTGTQGDWTAGQTYPFFDDSSGSIMTAYQIGYFPTIYLICSDRIVKEVGQIGLAQLETEAAVCPVLSETTKIITGSVVKDDNTNCVADNGEIALSNWGVTATGQNNTTVSTVSNANGVFKLYVDSLNTPFTLSFTPPNNWWSPCPAPPPIPAPVSDTIEVYHAAEVVVACPQLSAKIGAPLLRRCFDNYFQVDVCNNGTIMADDAYVEVILPPPGFLPVTTASLPFVVLAPGVYRFDLGDIQVGDCIHFNLVSKVSCDSAGIGQTLCFEAHAYPDTLCEPVAPGWSGASVSVGAGCNNGAAEFIITNQGEAPMPGPSNYIVIEDDVMFSEGVFQLNAGESISVSVPDNGSTWRLEALQVPNHPVTGIPSAALEGCTVLSTFTTGFILGYPIYDPSPSYDIECLEVVGSWDPNDKTGFPLGLTSQNLIAKNTDLDYLIRFQNTGTDTAFQVVVRDTLSNNVVSNSIRLGVTSHPYEFALENGNVLVFTFKDIKLVDSFANEPASHGFLRFKILQKPDLPDGTEITNRAGIYFDFNPPVMTNTTLHRIGTVPHVSGVTELVSGGDQLRVYPNPLNGAMLLRTEKEMPRGARWSLYDFSGKQIASGNMYGNTASLGIHLNAAGLYHVEFSSKEGWRLGGATIMR